MFKARTVSSWFVAILLAALFTLAALAKLTGAQTAAFEGWGYPAWFAILIGVLELAGAVGLLVPRLTTWAVYGLTVIMLGAAYTHLANQEAVQVVRPAIFLALLWALWSLRRNTSEQQQEKPPDGHP